MESFDSIQPLIPLKTTSYLTYQQFYSLPTDYTNVFHMDSRTHIDYVPYIIN